MENYCYFLQAGPFGLCEYPFSPERGIPFGSEESTVEFFEDGGAKFSIYAPNVKSVEIELSDESHRFALEKDGQDVWSLILYDIPAGLHYMRWFADDIEFINRKAPVLYAFGGIRNYVEIPDKEKTYYYLNPVKHGSIRQEYYESSFTGETRACLIYTPPSYEEQNEKRYPVLYALHGGGENSTAWMQQGKVNLILDNLIAEGLAEEMIVVMNDDYVFSEENRLEEGDAALMDNLSQLLIRDCIPFIDRKFRTVSDAEHRAVCGTSMGASQAQWLALHYSETVQSVGVFSGRLLGEIKGQEGHYDPSAFYETLKPEEFNKQYRYFLYARGLQESGEQLEKETELLKKQGFALDCFTAPGRHDWDFWRKAAKEFLEHLFRQQVREVSDGI